MGSRENTKNVHFERAANMSSDLQINAFLFASYLTEVTLAVFAFLMVFEIYSVNWWIILLNAWQLVFTGGFVTYLFNNMRQSDEIRNYMVGAVLSSLLLVVGHSIVQIMIGRSDSDEISAHTHSKLFQAYSNLSSSRITIFILVSILALNAIVFRKQAKAK